MPPFPALSSTSSTLPVIHRGHDGPGFLAHGLGLHARPEPHPLDFLPGNQPPLSGRYACLVILNDYVRMQRKYTHSIGAWHYSHLEPAILNDVRDRRAVLVFDLSNEGPAYDPALFAELQTWLTHHTLPAERCIFVSQNRTLRLLAGADPRVPGYGMRFVHYDFFIKITAALFCSDAQSNPLRPLPETWTDRLFDVNRKDKTFLCLNATPRLQRLLTIAALDQRRLLDDALVSFPGLNYAKQGIALDDVYAFIDRHVELATLRPAVARLATLSTRRIDAFTEIGNELVERIDPSVYERTFFSLVTESDFSNGLINRITEKLTKAFCMGHPALVVGNPNCVQFLTALGFQDWADVLNREVDAITNPAARFLAVIAEAERQVDRLRTSPVGWLSATSEVGRFNFHHAISGNFLRAYQRQIDAVVLDEILGALHAVN